MTIVELMVVITVVGVLMVLLLPAVQAAREASRRAHCRNNLKQIGLGCLMHAQSQGHLPTGGWGWAWIGDSSRGFDLRQPGGWSYNILPFVEQGALWSLSTRASAGSQDISRLRQTPLELFYCVTRRRPTLSSVDDTKSMANSPIIAIAAKCDYAINSGDVDCGGGHGPKSLSDADQGRFGWRDFRSANGVSHVRSKVTLADVLDGVSSTYLVGEKVTSTELVDWGDDQGQFTGYDYDSTRWTFASPKPDGATTVPDAFGSRHTDGAFFVYLDGSVRLVSYDVTPDVHRQAGNRADQSP